MKKDNSIAVVVVTYNRRKDLMICMDALLAQSHPVDEIIIVNNQSPDDTEQTLVQAGLVSLDEPLESELGTLYTKSVATPEGYNVKITYLLKKENDGGAGGFYAGMKTAYDQGYQWILLMDDDGRPDKDEVKNLLAVSLKNNLSYANALVINRDNHEQLAFNLFATPIETAYYDGIDIVENCGAPFNGTFINRQVIDKIGFIKREMYIWGDEAEYTARARQAGYSIATICSARHFHPKTGKTQNMIPFVKRWGILPPNTNRAGIFYRNQCYVFSTYGNKKALNRFVIRNIVGAFLNLQWNRLPKMIKAMRCGIKGDFSSNVL